MKKFFVLSVLAGLSIFSFASCDDTVSTFRFDFDQVPAAYDTTGLTKNIIEPNFYYFDVVVGTGDTAAPLDVVRAHYTLRRRPDNKVISSTYVNGNLTAPAFILAQRVEVYNYTGFQTGDFRGFRYGLPGMKTGGKRTVSLPAEYGFGFSTTFVLDIELESIVK